MLLRSSSLDEDSVLPIASARDSLSEDELARAAKFRLQCHRDRYVRGRAYIRRQLGSHVGAPAKSLTFRYLKNGKPFLADGPYFNFSRSGSLGVLAISDAGPVGVDLEQYSCNVDPDEVAEDCLTQDEIAALAELTGAARKERFLLFWTAKEALMKLTGEGMALAPLSIRLKLEDGRPAGRYESPRGEAPAFKHVQLANAICCVATEATGRQAEGSPAIPFNLQYDSVGVR